MRPLSLLAALSVLLLNSCYPPGDGKPPPLEELYFPTGVALDGLSKSDRDCTSDKSDCAPRYLYVANSDFDLQYRAASVLSYDLDLLRNLVPRNCTKTDDCQGDDICDAPGVEGIPTDDPERVPSYFCVDPVDTKPCGAFGDRDQADVVLNPGRCQSLDPVHPQDESASVLVDAVGIGAFATDVIWRTSPDASPDNPSRLFVPVRGDSTLHWIDLHDGHFACGQNGSNDNGCDERHRAGDSTSEADNPDQLEQPAEPYAIDATAHGDFVAITNQTTGSVSLYANAWSPNGGPRLVSILGNLSLSPVAIAALPEVEVAAGLPPAVGFLVAYRTAPEIDLLRVRDEATDTDTALANYTRYALREAASVPITANSLNFDSRGIAIDDSERQLDYQACRAAAGACAPGADPGQCQNCLRAAHQPEVYVASRAPASLLVGAMTADLSFSGTNELPSFTDSVALTAGPSRVILGDVKVPGTRYRDDAGPYDLERRVFVVCFDSRRIFVYDPKRRLIEAIVNTGRGPYALAVDRVRGLAYLGHFLDSYLGVISLDQRFPQTYAAIVASVGAPKSPRSSK
ncbi:MAG: hypothetical protein WDO69_20510 [Pseudomonadota bacterium]